MMKSPENFETFDSALVEKNLETMDDGYFVNTRFGPLTTELSPGQRFSIGIVPAFVNPDTGEILYANANGDMGYAGVSSETKERGNKVIFKLGLSQPQPDGSGGRYMILGANPLADFTEGARATMRETIRRWNERGSV